MMLLIMVLTLPWLIDFFHKFQVVGFTSRALQVPSFSPSDILNGLLHQAGEMNPLILLMGLTGLLFMGRKIRICILISIIYILFLVVWGYEIMPIYQIQRSQQFLVILLLWPTGLAFNHLSLRYEGWLARMAIVGLILAICLHTAINLRYYSLNLNRRIPRVASSTIVGMANWLEVNNPQDGRILLTGKTGMHYNGSAAYLQMYTNSAMIADYPVATLCHDLEVNLPKELCLTPPISPFNYHQLLRLYGISLIVEDRLDPNNPWTTYLAGLDFLEAAKLIDQRFMIYRVKDYSTGLVLHGSAKVQTELDHIWVEPDDKDDLVLKLCYVPGLKATNGVKIEEVIYPPGVRMIQCIGHQGRNFEIWFE